MPELSFSMFFSTLLFVTPRERLANIALRL
jgi:hypothetical protein